MKKSSFGKLTVFFNFLLLSIIFFTVSYFYEQRQSTGIFYTDIYFIWIIGCFCFLYNALYLKIKLPLLGSLCCIYLVLLFVLKSFWDVNSLRILITIFSCANVFYIFRAFNAKKHNLLLFAVILVSYIYQIFIGYKQALDNQFES